MIKHIVTCQEDFDSIHNNREMVDGNIDVVVELEEDIKIEKGRGSFSNVKFVGTNGVPKIFGDNFSGTNITLEKVHINLDSIKETFNTTLKKCFFNNLVIKNANIFTIKNCTGSSISFKYSNYIDIKDITFEEPIEKFGSSDKGLEVYKTKSANIENITVENEKYDIGLVLNKVSDICVEECTIEEASVGIEAKNAEGEIKGSSINNTTTGLVPIKSKLLIADCTFEGNDSCLNKDVAEQTSNLEFENVPAIFAEYIVPEDEED